MCLTPTYINDDYGADFNKCYHDYDYGDDQTSIKDLFWIIVIKFYYVQGVHVQLPFFISF